jgi:hypothetical protein
MVTNTVHFAEIRFRRIKTMIFEQDAIDEITARLEAKMREIAREEIKQVEDSRPVVVEKESNKRK